MSLLAFLYRQKLEVFLSLFFLGIIMSFSLYDHPTHSLSTPSSSGTVTYVTGPGSGNASGSDWDNARSSADLKSTIEAGGTVYVAKGTYYPGSQISISNNVCVIGGFPSTATGTDICNYDPIANPTTIDALGGHRLITANVVDSLELRGLVLQGGNTNSDGGALFSSLAITTPIAWKFTDLKITNNTSSNGSIAIVNKRNVDTEISFSNCVFYNNTTTLGGGLYFNNVFNSISSSALNTGKLVVEDCVFKDNTATGSDGGGIFMIGSNQWTFRRTTFCNNMVLGSNAKGGAGRFNNCYSTIIDDCSFNINYSASNGGAVYTTGSTITILDSDFVNNSTINTGAGGAIYGAITGGINLANSTFYDNESGSGGAVYCSSVGGSSFPNVIDACIFSSNETFENNSPGTSDGGGAVYFTENISISNSKFIDNAVPVNAWGGAIQNREANGELTNNLFYNNLKGTNTNIAGSDLGAFNGASNYSPMSGNKMQLVSSSSYMNQGGGTNSFSFTNDTFSNTDDGAIPAAPSISCPTDITPPSTPAGCTITEICGNGVDDDGDGMIDEGYPGGVSDHLQLWLKADVGTNSIVDGATINAWADQSNNGYSANADVNATDLPEYNADAINFNPSVKFDGVYTDDFSDGLHLGSDYIYSSNSGMNIFTALKPFSVSGNNSSDRVVSFGNTAFDTYGFSWSTTSKRMGTPGSHGGNNNPIINQNFSIEPSLVQFNIEFNQTQSLLQNGTTIGQSPISLSQLTTNEIEESDHFGTIANGDHQQGPFSIGRVSASEFLNLDRIFAGDIGEVIVYDDLLTIDEQQRINTYLAIKYGIIFPHDYVNSSGTTIKSVSDGYANNIAGIGEDNCGALLQKQSTSQHNESIITIGLGSVATTNPANTNTFTADNTLLIWGHNGAAENPDWYSNNYDVASVEYNGVDRIWKLDEIGDVGQIEFIVETNDPGYDLPHIPSAPESDEFMYILFDDDGDFTNGGTTALPLQDDNNFATSRVTWMDAESSFFTFAITEQPPQEICNNGIDDDGDGLIDCFDDDCANQYAISFTSDPAVDFPENVLGEPNESSYAFVDVSEFIVLELAIPIEAGDIYSIGFGSSIGTYEIEESIDGINFAPNSNSPFTIGNILTVDFTASQQAKFIKIIYATTNADFAVDLPVDGISHTPPCGSCLTLNLTNDQICSSAVVALDGENIPGGVFSGPGVTGNTFDPTSVGNGIHLITYTFDNGAGCINSVVDSIEVLISTYNAINTHDDAGVTNPANAIGSPDGMLASLPATASIVLELAHTIDIGTAYSIDIGYTNGEYTVEESVDGTNFFPNSSSPIIGCCGSETVDFTATQQARFVRVTHISNNIGANFELDGISYLECSSSEICGNEIDDDFDGFIDEDCGFTNCDSLAYILSDLGGASQSTLRIINMEADPFTLDSLVSISPIVNAAGYRVQDDFIYGMARNNNNELIRIGPDGSVNLGTVTGLPDGNYTGGDVFADGYLYVKPGLKNNDIYQIDVTSVPPVLINAHELSLELPLGDFAYSDADNMVYSVSTFGKKYMIDPTTWVVTEIGTQGKIQSYGAIYTSAEGKVFAYGNDDGNVYQVDFGLNGTGTGNMYLVGTAPIVSSNDGASCRGILITPEICENGIDDDGDGLIDTLDPDCCGAQAPTLSKQ